MFLCVYNLTNNKEGCFEINVALFATLILSIPIKLQIMYYFICIYFTVQTGIINELKYLN